MLKKREVEIQIDDTPKVFPPSPPEFEPFETESHPERPKKDQT